MKYQETSAVIEGPYRYMLRRAWNLLQPRILFVMLNPSTADHEKDDATIRSLVRLCTALGYGSFEVVNLFAFRATNPNELYEISDSIGPKNDLIIRNAVKRCDLVVCAWGAHPLAEPRGQTTLEKLRYERPAVFCFGRTKAGAPKHPLYVKTGTQLQHYG